MGIEHSVVRERRPRSKNEENDVLIIQRSDLDLPEAYRAVELSDQSITDCLAVNPQRVLLCQHFLDIYKDCIAQHKSKLIQDQFPQEK
uniref:COX assembly mitochondrial protein n=1 Tax=Meloidogyne floridensis TaxID=298350 RepID=A0A915P8C8_9BILA